MKLIELLSIIPYYQTDKPIDKLSISKIEMDNRKIETGDLFVCIKGFTVDGHQFAKEAVKAGATAVIAEKNLHLSVPTIVVSDTTRTLAMIANKFYAYPSEELHLIGITGTNGKTTITYLLETIFKQAKQKTGLIGTIAMKIGNEDIPVTNTTPDALLLQQSLKKMVNEQVDTAMMEVSSHALDLGRVFGCDYDIAVYTNLSQDHLDYHQNMEEYFHAKSLLFSQLGNNYQDGKEKFAVINIDDDYGKRLNKSTAQHVITYGCHHVADVSATNIQLHLDRTMFQLQTPIGEVKINSPLIGMFNVYNSLAASSAAVAAKIPLKIIKAALESIKGVDGRFEQVSIGQNFAVIVDYAHTPDSLENVLETIDEFKKKKVYVVVGCGGDRDKTKRPLMAQIALDYADEVILTSDNPRTEAPNDILDDMITNINGDHFEIIPGRKQAISRAVELATDGDIILIAGKGHETYQEINHVKYDFDDREVAKEAIRLREI